MTTVQNNKKIMKILEELQFIITLTLQNSITLKSRTASLELLTEARITSGMPGQRSLGMPAAAFWNIHGSIHWHCIRVDTHPLASLPQKDGFMWTVPGIENRKRNHITLLCGVHCNYVWQFVPGRTITAHHLCDGVTSAVLWCLNY